MIVIGIDVGLGGAIAALQDGTEPVSIWDAPTIRVGKKHDYNILEMVITLREIAEDKAGFYRPRVIAYMEKVHTMPAQGIVSSGKLMRGLGLWEGLLTALGIPYTLVAPQTWKKVMLMNGAKDKGASILRALQLWPDMAKAIGRNHNRAEALLIAEYGRRIIPRAEVEARYLKG